MKKIFILVLVLTLLAVMITPALAADPNDNSGKGGNGNGGGCNGGCGITVNGNGTGSGTGDGTGGGSGKSGKMPNVLIGTIISIDPLIRTVTVDVLSANIAAKDYVGQVITFMTSTRTVFELRNSDGTSTPITFEYLAVDQNVSVAGILSDTGWIATRIAVGADLLCLP